MVTRVQPADLLPGVLVPGQFAVDGAAPEKIQVTTPVVYRLTTVALRRTPVADLAVQASRTINTAEDPGQFWGVFLIQIDGNGDVTTLAPSANQAYETEAAALAATPAPSGNNVAIGRLTIQTLEDADWTSQTDDLTDDVAAAHFHSEPAIARVLVGEQIRPRAFTWVGPTDAAHKVEIAERPQVIWERVAGSVGSVHDDPHVWGKFSHSFARLDVWTLQSGTLYLYH